MLSFAELESGVGALAVQLVAAGSAWRARGKLAEQDALACLMPLAAARAGLMHVPINPLLKRAQVAHILAGQRRAAAGDERRGVGHARAGRTRPAAR